MKANESEVLLLRDYVGTGATREQFIKTFATASSRRASKRPRKSERDIITRLVGKIARKEAAIASLARMKAEAELASLYRERAIARAWAARRDPKKKNRRFRRLLSKSKDGWTTPPLMIEKP